MGRRISAHPSTAPSVRPGTKERCSTGDAPTSGIEIKRSPAMTGPYSTVHRNPIFRRASQTLSHAAQSTVDRCDDRFHSSHGFGRVSPVFQEGEWATVSITQQEEPEVALTGRMREQQSVRIATSAGAARSRQGIAGMPRPPLVCRGDRYTCRAPPVPSGPRRIIRMFDHSIQCWSSKGASWLSYPFG